jgi:hypothetical protein
MSLRSTGEPQHKFRLLYATASEYGKIRRRNSSESVLLFSRKTVRSTITHNNNFASVFVWMLILVPLKHTQIRCNCLKTSAKENILTLKNEASEQLRGKMTLRGTAWLTQVIQEFVFSVVTFWSIRFAGQVDRKFSEKTREKSTWKTEKKMEGKY